MTSEGSEKSDLGNHTSKYPLVYEGTIPIDSYCPYKEHLEKIKKGGGEKREIQGEKYFRFRYIAEEDFRYIEKDDSWNNCDILYYTCDDLYYTENEEMVLHRIRAPTIKATYPTSIKSTVHTLTPSELEVIVKDYYASKRNHLDGSHKCARFSETFLDSSLKFLLRQWKGNDSLIIKWFSDRTPVPGKWKILEDNNFVLDDVGDKKLKALKEYYTADLEKKQTSATTWNDIGRELAKVKEFDVALKAYDKIKPYDKVQEFGPDNLTTWRLKWNALCCLKKYDSADETYDKALELNFKSFGFWWNKGDTFRSLREYSTAVEAYNKALKINPYFPGLWESKGEALCCLRKYEEAVEAYNKALEINPNIPELLKRKGEALCNLEKYTEAIEVYDKALIIDPHILGLWENKGDALFCLKKYDAADEAYDKALELNPKTSRIWRIWWDKGNTFRFLRKYSEAVDAYNKALEINPHILEIWESKGEALRCSRKYEEAVEAYDIALKINPHILKIWESKGEALRCSRKYEEAVEAYERALKINPDIPELLKRKGEALCYSRKYEEAVEAYDKALGINSNDVGIWRLKASAFRHLGRIEDAENCSSLADNLQSHRIDPQTVLTTLLPEKAPRLLFYPSAGNTPRYFCDFDADILIFSDSGRISFEGIVKSCFPHTIDEVAETAIVKIFRINQKKWGLFFFMDNNRVVELIRQSKHKISWFIGICDGCAEGGNHECVNEMPFFGKILDLMPRSGMSYITDHGPHSFPRGRGNPPHDFIIGNSEYTGKFVSDLHQIPGGYGPVNEFHIRRKIRKKFTRDYSSQKPNLTKFSFR